MILLIRCLKFLCRWLCIVHCDVCRIYQYAWARWGPCLVLLKQDGKAQKKSILFSTKIQQYFKVGEKSILILKAVLFKWYRQAIRRNEEKNDLYVYAFDNKRQRRLRQPFPSVPIWFFNLFYICTMCTYRSFIPLDFFSMPSKKAEIWLKFE